MSINDLSAGSGLAFNDWLYRFLSDGPPSRTRGINFRGNLGALPDDWDEVRSDPINVVLIGDSLGLYNITGSFGFLLADHLARISGNRPSGSSFHASKTLGSIPQFLTMQGTDATASTSGYGRTLTAGQKGTLAIPATASSRQATAISIVYSTTPGGTGELTVRDGVAGTSLGTISNDAEAKSGRVWTSAAITRGARTFEVENTGSGSFVLDQALVHDQSRTAGTRVWNASRVGATAAQYVSNPAWGLDLIENTQPDVVLVQFGTNGSDQTTNLTALVAEVRDVAPNALVIGIVPYENTSLPYAEIEDIRAGLVNCDDIVDLASLIPRPNEQGLLEDGVHPTQALSDWIALILAITLSGDPLGILIAMMQRRLSKDFEFTQTLTGPLAITNGTTTTTYNNVGVVYSGDTVTTGSGGVVSYFTALAALLGSPADGVVRGGHINLTAQTTAAAPSNGATLNVNASGELVVRFANGTTKTIANNT